MHTNTPRFTFIFLIASLVLMAACSGQTSTQVLSPKAMEVEGTPFTVYQGGYGFTVPLGYDLQIDRFNSTISTPDGSVMLSLNGSWDLETQKDASQILDTMLDTLFSAEGSQVSTSKAIPVILGSSEGSAYDFSGTFVANAVQGRALVVKPDADRYIFLLGLANEYEDPNLWEENGLDAFEAVFASLMVLPEETLKSAKLCPISADKDYGLSPENPIQVGGGLVSGLLRELAYLDNLAGRNGEAVTYERIGSIQTEGSIVDEYKVIVGSQEFTLYLDEYTYGVINVPRGLGCKGAFPLSEP